MVVHRGYGRHVVHIPPGDNLYQLRVYLFAIFFTSNASLSFARISIACLLLQVTQRRSWRIAIVATIAVQAFMMVFYVIIQLVQCSSLAGSTLGSGTKDRPGNCLGPDHVRVFAYVKICTFFFFCSCSPSPPSPLPSFHFWKQSKPRLIPFFSPPVSIAKAPPCSGTSYVPSSPSA